MTTDDAPKRRWRVPPGSPFAWAHAESGHVLYHRPSGRTHFVNDGTALLLGRCLLEPHDAQGAAYALADLQDAEPDPAFLERVADLLVHLEHLGLVDPVPA